MAVEVRKVDGILDFDIVVGNIDSVAVGMEVGRKVDTAAEVLMG